MKTQKPRMKRQILSDDFETCCEMIRKLRNASHNRSQNHLQLTLGFWFAQNSGFWFFFAVRNRSDKQLLTNKVFNMEPRDNVLTTKSRYSSSGLAWRLTHNRASFQALNYWYIDAIAKFWRAESIYWPDACPIASGNSGCFQLVEESSRDCRDIMCSSRDWLPPSPDAITTH